MEETTTIESYRIHVYGVFTLRLQTPPEKIVGVDGLNPLSPGHRMKNGVPSRNLRTYKS